MNRRCAQISSIVKAAIASGLTKIKITSGFLTITKVEISPDLKIAHIWISNSNPQEKDWNVEILKNHLAVFIEELKKANLRYLPRLYFHKDKSEEYVEKIDKLIKKIHES